MALRLPRAKFRCLLLGLLCTLALAAFLGIALVQERTWLSTSGQRDGGMQRGLGAQHSLCVLIPFRDRFEELLEFAPHLHQFLQKQGVQHKLVAINQLDRYRFNRASLINVGFLETRQQCDYIAMHDVDLLPLNEDLRYEFPELGPFHLSAPHLHPLYHYKTFVGGILLLQSTHFESLNGLSNKYWGWGREDDEFFVRMKVAKLKLGRPGNLTTGYRSFRHIHDRKKRPRDHNNFFNQREHTRRLDKETGVSTTKYAVDSVNELSIDGAPVTIINVFLECDEDFTPWCLQSEDHAAYKKKLDEKQQLQPPLQNIPQPPQQQQHQQQQQQQQQPPPQH